jgi:hypothetical protein
MSDEDVTDRIIEAARRYQAAAHAMQSGVRVEIDLNLSRAHEPKHLRVGINSALANDEAMARLLISKGVFTEVEYHEAVAQGMEREVERYEKKLGVKLR